MKENKFFIVKIGTILFILLLFFSLKSYAFKVEVKAEEPDYSGGAKVKISADENMKKIKIYKKISNNKYILFYIGKPNAKEITIVVPNSNLSTENKTELKVVTYNDKEESATSDGSIDKVKPRVSMNPEETARALDSDGWLHTGDLGIIDNEGFISLKGRSKTMILTSSGQNVYPEEIESRLCNFPLVSECVVVSRAAKIVSIIYPNPDLTKGMSSEQIETELAQYQKQINSEMPAYMQINKIQVRDQEFEKTPKKSIKRYLYE